jgi:hypothetical protein
VEEELWITQLPIDTSERQSSPSTFTDDPQNCLGVPHLAYLTSLKGLEHLPPFAL